MVSYIFERSDKHIAEGLVSELCDLPVDQLVCGLLIHSQCQLDRPVIVENYTLLALVGAPVILVGVVLLLEAACGKFRIGAPCLAGIKY